VTQFIDPRFHFTRREDIISGMFKFRNLNDHGTNSGFMRLLNFASVWKTGEPDRLLTVFVRYNSKHNADSALGFIYQMPGGGERFHDEFFERMSAELRDEFGDNYRGYDLSSPTWVIE